MYTWKVLVYCTRKLTCTRMDIPMRVAYTGVHRGPVRAMCILANYVRRSDVLISDTTQTDIQVCIVLSRVLYSVYCTTKQSVYFFIVNNNIAIHIFYRISTIILTNHYFMAFFYSCINSISQCLQIFVLKSYLFVLWPSCS